MEANSKSWIHEGGALKKVPFFVPPLACVSPLARFCLIARASLALGKRARKTQKKKNDLKNVDRNFLISQENKFGRGIPYG